MYAAIGFASVYVFIALDAITKQTVQRSAVCGDFCPFLVILFPRYSKLFLVNKIASSLRCASSKTRITLFVGSFRCLWSY
jgi:hypothetical protein